MEAYIGGHRKIGDHKMKSAKILLEKAVSGCGWLAEDMVKINNQFKMMQ